MSMFYELMMRKKEQIMYATIKGSLTENNGVFSGFSSSNYLQLQQNLDTSKPFEIVVKFTTDTLSLNNSILYESSYGFFIRAKYSGGRKIYIDLSHTENYDIANNVAGQITLQNDTTYWLKFSFDLSKYVVSLSTDGINYTEDIVVNSTLTLKNSGHIDIGSREGTSTYVQGSIDLPNSYIKFGATKYNLQAVVGYTVVGSPTIVDGVVSGFSSANYIYILDFPNTFNSLEIVTKAKKSATGNQPIFALQNGSISQQKFYLYMVNSACLFYYRTTNDETKNISISYSVNVDVYYYFRLKISNSKIKLGYSTDGTNWVEKEIADTMVVASNMDFRFGVVTNNNWYLNGSIDMNETLIKINNKLWFNGQQA